MSAKLYASYEHIDEIAEILRLLKPITFRVDFQPAKGRYKRAYITLKTIPRNDDNPNRQAPSGCIPPADMV